jgi:hypothetical protein
MDEGDQQILTGSVVREIGLNLFELWMHYLSIGGSAGRNSVGEYVRGSGSLPRLERDLLARATNELVIDSPSLPQAPYSESPLVQPF